MRLAITLWEFDLTECSSQGCVHMPCPETPGAHSQNSPQLSHSTENHLLGFYLRFVTFDLDVVVLLWLKLVHRIQLCGMREGRKGGREE